MADFLLAADDEDEENDIDMMVNDNDHNKNKKQKRNYDDHKQNDGTTSTSTTPSKSAKKRSKKEEEPLTEEQKQEIKEKVKLRIAKTVDEIVQFRVKQWNDNNDFDKDEEYKLKSSKEFVFGLTELIYDTAVIMGSDLEKFRDHRNKKTVIIEDFMLYCRRNQDMKQKMVDHYNKTKQGF